MGRAGMAKKRRFVLYLVLIFLISLTSLTAVGYVPVGVREANNFFFSLFIHETKTPKEVSGAIPSSVPYTLPIRIVIPKIGVNADVLNPQTQEPAVLDAALLKGAVRYPGSGDLEGDKNIFIFGHSSELPVVHNQSFKIFNQLKNLNIGDEIVLKGKSRGYRYKVSSVALAKAEDALVSLGREHKLVLSTCNSFGKKEDRFVVYADFVGSYPLSKS